jgi:Fur family ferric uptake transcriptional regulator
MKRSVDQGVAEVLRAKGRRITAQRRLVLEIIAQRKGHLDAGEIHRWARKKDPRISLSTVYRNLNLLKELGLISELHLDQEHHHYEVKEQTEHYHLICSRCGKIVEFDNPLVGKLTAQVGKEKGFSVERVHMDLVGLCDECRAREEK